jgi:hypothetical protein
MDMNKLIHAILFTPGPQGRWGLQTLLWGEPGTGKTVTIAAVAKAAGLPYYRISPAERGEGQFGVVPVPVDGKLTYPAPEWVRELEGGGILFLDEINTAPPALQAPLLGLSQLGVLGAHTFGPRVRLLAAANETMDSAGGWDLATSLANRFGHVQFDGLSANDWGEALLGGFAQVARAVNAQEEEARVMATWAQNLGQARGLVAGFIRHRPECLHKKPRRGDPAASRAWASRRSWEMATHALAGAATHGLDEITGDELLSGFVGAAVTIEFSAWRREADLPDAGDLLDGKVQWSHDPSRLDRTFAVLGACIGAVEGAVKDKTRLDTRTRAMWALIGSVLSDAPDVVEPAARGLLRIAPRSGMQPEAAKVLHAMRGVLSSAGVQADGGVA